jgi:hypothetical protein
MIDPKRILPTPQAVAEPMRIRWFGAPWNPAACEPDFEISIPTEPCGDCELPFAVDAQGVSLHAAGAEGGRLLLHLDCFLGMLGLAPCRHCGVTHRPTRHASPAELPSVGEA